MSSSFCSSSSSSSSSKCCDSSPTLLGISCSSSSSSKSSKKCNRSSSSSGTCDVSRTDCSSPSSCVTVSCSKVSECGTSVSACTTSTQDVLVQRVYPAPYVYAEATPIKCAKTEIQGQPQPLQPTESQQRVVVRDSLPDITGFNTIVGPIKNLVPQYSPANSGAIQIRIRRKNKTVTLQWEPFNGAIAQAGRNWFGVEQKIANLPPYSLRFPIQILYKGISRLTVVALDPDDPNQIKFYLALNGEEINVDDSFYIFAGAVTWIVD